MNAKHQFKYTAEGFEDIAPVEITYEIPSGEATITEMLRNFEYYLKAVGYHFDGHLDIVNDYGCMSDCYEEEPQGGCMADFDKECGCESTSSPLEDDEYYKSKKLKEWNEGIAKLEAELKAKRDSKQQAYDRAAKNAAVIKNNWVHGICNPPSPDWKKK